MDYPPEGTTAYTSTADDLGKALKIILYILVGGVCFLASFVAYLYVFLLPPAPEYISEQTTYAIPIDPEDFSPPIDTFTADKEEIAMSSDDTLSMHVDMNDTIIYPFGYLSTDGRNWRRVSMIGEDMEGQWIIGETSFNLSLSSDDFEIEQFPYRSETHLIVYSCSRSALGHWDCHGGWQIKTFNTTLVKAREITQGDTCGGCPRGYTCFLDKCTKSTIVENRKQVEAGESLLVFAEEDYIITVTGIGGDAKTAKLKINGKEVSVDISSGQAYVRDGDLRFVVTDIQPFSLNQDGSVEMVVLSDYDKIEYCEDCVYTPPTTYIPSSSGGSRRTSSVSSCTPKCEGKECGPDGCGDTCGSCQSPETCNSTGFCECIPSDELAQQTCVGVFVDDMCGGTTEGLLEPDCYELECGRSPNDCGWCNTTDNYCENTYGANYCCENNICQIGPCESGCTNKECGSDGGDGSCGTCTNEHGTTECYNFLCNPQCLSGWGDCDGDRTNGCETDLNTNSDCGSCGSICDGKCIGGECCCTEQQCGYDSVCEASCGDCTEYGVACDPYTGQCCYTCVGILCLPPPPADEICGDTIDNDCDGDTDETPCV
jgi:hypothetical protein